MSRELHNALNHFRQCAQEAPAGCYEQAKQLNDVIGQACVDLMRQLRALGLNANTCDLAFELEAAMYDYARKSNPDASVFPTAEGFGSGLSGPARERALAQAVSNRDFLRSVGH